MRTSAELREGFLSFFESKGHMRRPSASLIPRADDRSTLLTTAGMQPQMPYFLGREPPPAPMTTSTQKCFRTPDIDDVGLDTYHLTFFEMLGNFSFGQYFKEVAIEYATEFIRDRLKLDWDRLWVSVHAGDPELKLGPDQVAIDLWERIGMPPERIVPLPSSENFWSVGGPGPCGPDSEIYYDWGEEVSCGQPDCAPGCTRCERFLEFWNLVFMEFELHPDGTLTPLPKQNIDTGLGLERTARIVQDVPSVYDTDGFQDIMRWIASESGVAYGDSPEATKAHRVLADHGRGMTFLVADGVTPSNEGRGYVLRRVIRRAMVNARTLGLERFLPRLADVVIEQMGHAFPELTENTENVHRALAAEEERFLETLERGMRYFSEFEGEEIVTGEQAFTLVATYGLPFELIEELARDRGQAVDEEGFRREMDRHREISRAGGERFEQRAADFAAAAGFRTEFVGYEKKDVRTQIGALEQVEDGLFLAKLRESPFYPAGGGQVSDTGEIESEDGSRRATLREAYRFENDQALLFDGDSFEAGERVRALVPWSVRFPTMANHTATHLLHEALREVLGDHVHQAGSAVRPDKLRFDFTHAQPLTPDERAEVERLVNEKVFENLPVHIFETPIDEARKLGATMLFGEKYGDVVRVVEVGDGWSRELCGGTHVRTTAEVGPFAILTESSVGAGARRIEAVSAGEAYALLHERAREADELRGEIERMRKEAKKTPKRGGAEYALKDERVFEVGGVNALVAEVPDVDPDRLLEVSDAEKQKRRPAAVVLATRENGKVHLVANFDNDVGRRISAADVIKQTAAVVGGGGGGRPTMARAGGSDPEKLPEALETAQRLLREGLS